VPSQLLGSAAGGLAASARGRAARPVPPPWTKTTTAGLTSSFEVARVLLVVLRRLRGRASPCGVPSASLRLARLLTPPARRRNGLEVGLRPSCW